MTLFQTLGRGYGPLPNIRPSLWPNVCILANNRESIRLWFRIVLTIFSFPTDNISPHTIMHVNNVSIKQCMIPSIMLRKCLYGVAFTLISVIQSI